MSEQTIVDSSGNQHTGRILEHCGSGFVVIVVGGIERLGEKIESYNRRQARKAARS